MRLRAALGLAAAAVIALDPAASAAQAPDAAGGGIDWDDVGREAADLLARYIRIDTTNPPGDEIAAARFLRDILIGEGVEFLLVRQEDGKAALVGRLRSRADPARGSVVLLNHMDVVAAAAEHWSVDPFGGVIRDGYVWGRGALDMKGQAIAQLMAMLLLRRHGPELDRDVVFLATSDEEIVGGADAGALIREHRALLEDAALVLNEGGAIRVGPMGELRYHAVGVTEKSPFWQRLTARGPAGHGSLPADSSAVHRLVRALERIRTWDTGLRLTPPVAEFFRRLAEVEPSETLAGAYREIESAIEDSTVRAALLSDPYHAAILRNTVAITGLTGSPKTNVIPPTASAELDIRLLPGQDPDSFTAALRERVGANGDSLALEPIGFTWAATASPTSGEGFRAIAGAARSLDPGAPVLPYILAGYTDSHYFREIGVPSYGVGLFRLSAAEAARVHGNDERVSIENLAYGTRLLYEILVRLGT